MPRAPARQVGPDLAPVAVEGAGRAAANRPLVSSVSSGTLTTHKGAGGEAARGQLAAIAVMKAKPPSAGSRQRVVGPAAQGGEAGAALVAPERQGRPETMGVSGGPAPPPGRRRPPGRRARPRRADLAGGCGSRSRFPLRAASRHGAGRARVAGRAGPPTRVAATARPPSAPARPEAAPGPVSDIHQSLGAQRTQAFHFRGGFQNSRTRRPATRKRQAAWSRDWTTKPSRS